MAQVGIDLSALPLSELPLLPLVARMLTELGTPSLDEVAFSRRVGATTGGLGVSTWTSGVPQDRTDMVGYLMLRGKATAERAPDLMGLSAAMLTEVHMDQPQRCVESPRRPEP